MFSTLTSYAKSCFRERFTLSEGEFEVKISRYKGEKESSKDILIIPPTGGVNILDRSYARVLCAAGFNATILETFTDEDEYNLELSIHTRYYARVQKAINITLKTIPENHSLGILGTSVGAFHAAIAAGLHARITSALTITGGADIAGIIVNSDQKLMTVAKEKRMEMYHFGSEEDYLHALREHIELEPLNYNYKNKKLGMVIATSDHTVPTKNQELLFEHWRPEVYKRFNNDHFWAILRTWIFHTDFVVDFFKSAHKA